MEFNFYRLRHSGCHQSLTVIATPFCTHRLPHTTILYSCSTSLLRFHNPDGRLAVYLPINVTGAPPLDRAPGFDKVHPFSRGRLWAGCRGAHPCLLGQRQALAEHQPPSEGGGLAGGGGGAVPPPQVFGAEKRDGVLRAVTARWWRALQSHVAPCPSALKEVGQDHGIYRLALGLFSATCGGPNT